MSSQSVPQTVALRKAVKAVSEYSGDLPLSRLKRLAEKCYTEVNQDESGEVQGRQLAARHAARDALHQQDRALCARQCTVSAR